MDREYAYDVFLSYAPADSAWARNELRPRLERAGLRVAESDDLFDPGAPLLDNYQHAVEQARRTIIVFSPAWLASDIHKFLLLLLRTMDPDAAKRRLLPLVVAPCVLPREITALRLETASFVDPAFQERQYRRVERAIRARIPPADYGPALDKRSRAYWEQWWLYYGPRVRRGALVVFLIWLLGSMLFQLPPFFQPRPVWHALSLQARSPFSLGYTADTFVVGGSNPDLGCGHVDRGLWTGTQRGAQWQPYTGALLCFEDPTQGQVLAAVARFATTSANVDRIYAATSDVGLLRSDDRGQHWVRTGMTGLAGPKLVGVAADPDAADRVYVTTEGAGIYRSDNAGVDWQRLDRPSEKPDPTPCPAGYISSSARFPAQAGNSSLIVAAHKLFAGTPDPRTVRADGDLPGGLYIVQENERCWRRVDIGDTRYSYHQLAQALGPDGGSLLALKRDWQTNAPAISVVRFDLSSPQLDASTLHVFDHGIDSLAVVGDAWYVTDPLGGVVRGRIDQPEHIQELPRVSACGILTCRSALAAVPWSDYPVLLSTACYLSPGCSRGSGRLFVMQQGPWWEGLYPYGFGLP